MLTKFKILTQMLIVNLGLVFIGLIVFVVIVTRQIYNISSSDMDEIMLLRSQEVSQMATNTLNVPINVAKTLSNTLSVSIS